jgi:hypothetical protein
MKPLQIVMIVFALLLVALAVVYFRPDKAPQPPATPEPQQTPIAIPEAEPEIRYPLPETPPPATETEAETPAVQPLPALGESDAFTSDLLNQLFGEATRKKLLSSQNFLQRLVMIIDALPRKNLPMQHVPVRSPLGSFQTAGEPGAEIIALENFNRYEPYVALAEAASPQRLAATYLRVYPLLEQAYRDLGHPKGYFHDRMIEVLDHLLATPRVAGPISVKEHVVRYRYTDPQLEALSAGRKILLRMGPENAERVKKVLGHLRSLLVVSRTETVNQPAVER